MPAQIHQSFLVVNKKNTLISGGKLGADISGNLHYILTDRKKHLKGRPLPRSAFHRNGSLVAFDDSVNHGKPHARALLPLFGGKKRIKYPRFYFRRHAVAGVADFQPDIVAGAYVEFAGLKFRINRNIVQAHRQ